MTTGSHVEIAVTGSTSESSYYFVYNSSSKKYFVDPLKGKCTCPKGQNCKHLKMVAEYLEKEK